MNKEDKHFIEGYEKLLNKGYCNCNEMNCIDNNSPRRILNIVKQLEQENHQLKEQIDIAIEYIEENKIKSKYCRVECGFDTYIVLNENNQKDLLEILKESEVDECE